MFSENNSTSVMIGSPMYNGNCYFGYTSSLIENVLDLRQNNIGAYWTFLPNESLITRGRNYIVDIFMKSQCSHLMFIDADIVFPSNSIRTLLSAGEDIICAPYPKKFIDWDAVEAASKLENRESLDKYTSSYVINYIDNANPPIPDYRGVVEVAHAGTGFMLISRKVFEMMTPHVPKARPSNFGRFNVWYNEYFRTGIGHDSVFMSEDWLFCEEWRNIGGKVHLMPGIKLDHIGTHIYTGSIGISGANVT